MATSQQRRIVTAMVFFLYFMLNVFLGLVTSSSSNWNDPAMISNIDVGNITFINVPKSISLRPTADKNIKVEDVPQVITLALGFSSLQTVQWNGLSAGNLFEHPKSNVLFIIEYFRKETYFSFTEESPTFTVLKNKENSIVDIFRLSSKQNFATHISNVLKNKPLVTSFSADMLLARAAAASGNNAYTIKWDPQEQSFQDDSKTFDLTQDKIIKMFESADFGKGVKYHVEDKMFYVTQTKKKEVFFDMNIKDDFLFFAEMQTLFYLYEKVKTFNELIHDEYVDLFTFGVSTIKGISQRYGSNSPKVDAAFYVLKNTIPKVSQLFNDLYNGEALVEIVGWREKRNQDESPSPQLINGVNNDRDGTIRFKRDTLLKNDARKNDKNLASLDDAYNEEFPSIFNISLWLMIILVLTVYAVSIVMWYMDPGRDSIIYRVTSQHIKSE